MDKKSHNSIRNATALIELVERDRKLFTELHLLAVAKSVTVGELLKEYGVELHPTASTWEILELQNKLNEMAEQVEINKTTIYGNKAVKKLLRKFADELGLQESVVLWELGFQVKLQAPSDDCIEWALKQLYPDGTLFNVSKDYPRLYSFCVTKAKSNGLKTLEYLELLGFRVRSGRGCRRVLVINRVVPQVILQNFSLPTSESAESSEAETTEVDEGAVSEVASVEEAQVSSEEATQTVEDVVTAIDTEGTAQKYLAELETLKKVVSEQEQSAQATTTGTLTEESDTKVLMDLLDIFPNKRIHNASPLRNSVLKLRISRVAERNNIQPITLLKIWGFELLDYDLVGGN